MAEKAEVRHTLNEQQARQLATVTKTVPIVMFSGDPIGQGLIGSLSHPGVTPWRH